MSDISLLKLLIYKFHWFEITFDTHRLVSISLWIFAVTIAISLCKGCTPIISITNLTLIHLGNSPIQWCESNAMNGKWMYSLPKKKVSIDILNRHFLFSDPILKSIEPQKIDWILNKSVWLRKPTESLEQLSRFNTRIKIVLDLVFVFYLLAKRTLVSMYFRFGALRLWVPKVLLSK